ncbi:MAG: di-trans,poly-cis-decaprenylcistransferase [Clostridiales bacterium]|nr:di-trans,poly-cis-decaprenylcistransferase [Clostridiales bacterium]HOA85751.1 polyprenyl diphosphate synthase [Bacillota bacterium]
MSAETTGEKNLYGLRHIAFIMDGNRRWAARHGLPKEQGHRAGAKAFHRVVKYCRDIGIRYVTVYALSTENLKNRPAHELDAIMRLLDDYLSECIKETKDQKVSFRFLGNIEVFDDKLKEKIRQVAKRTSGNEYVLNIALNYGGRAELVRAFNILFAAGKSEITEEDISGALYTAGCPDPDLIIRTAGECRISNFLLWQASYSEFYFTDVLWPDFGPREVDMAIEEFGRRQRRYGGS